MASLIVAAGIFAHTKIKNKKVAKKEKKRKQYQDRYDELEQEHKQKEENSLQRRQTQSSIGDGALSSPTIAQRRDSSESQRGEKTDLDDNPTKWVEEALRDRDGAKSP